MPKKMTAGWQDITFAGDATHIFSHVEWHMKGYLIRVPKGSIPVEFAADVGQLKTQKAIPNAFILYTRKIMGILEKNEK